MGREGEGMVTQAGMQADFKFIVDCQLLTFPVR